MRRSLSFFVSLLCLFSLSIYAQDSLLYLPKADHTGQAQVESKLRGLGIQLESLKEARGLEGFYEAYTEQGMMYVSKDGRRLMMGKLYSIEQQPIDLTEQSMSAFRLELLENSTEKSILYPAKKERYEVTIFTDHTCPYCRQLHDQMDEYHALGISIRYMAFPRAGLEDQSARELGYIFCAQDAMTAMSDAMGGKKPKVARCEGMNLANHLKMGHQMGVSGTPGIILPDGRLIPGFLPADRLIQELRRGAL